MTTPPISPRLSVNQPPLPSPTQITIHDPAQAAAKTEAEAVQTHSDVETSVSEVAEPVFNDFDNHAIDAHEAASAKCLCWNYGHCGCCVISSLTAAGAIFFTIYGLVKSH